MSHACPVATQRSAVVTDRAWFPWNGSKRWLLPAIADVVRKWAPVDGARYFEPFVGSGAVSQWIRQLHPNVPQVVGDAHPWLAAAFASQMDVTPYVVPANYLDLAYWRGMRDADAAHMTVRQRADRFAVCLLTAWGNRWRTSVSGSFNMMLNPKFCEPERLRVHLEAFGATRWLGPGDRVHVGDWRSTCENARAGDLVYLDPPYPETFGYGMRWTLDDLFDLADWALACPASVIISNVSAMERPLSRAGFITHLTEELAAQRTRQQRREVLAWSLRGVG